MKIEGQQIADRILVKNNQFIAVNKQCGEPVQDDPGGDRSLIHKVAAYCKHPVHVVNRLDRPAGGIVVFAKNARAMTELSAQFRDGEVQKEYLAAVDKEPRPPEGELDHFLTVDRQANKSHISDLPGQDGRRSRLGYRLLGSLDHYHILHIRLGTGRHHQIRAQLASIGCHCKGDVKYGARRKNPDRSIHLHAWRLSMQHPVSREIVRIEAPLPQDPVWDAAIPFLEQMDAGPENE